MAVIWAKHANSIAGWCINVALLVVAVASDAIKPRNEYIVYRELYKYSYPHKNNTVPSWSVLLYALVGSSLVLILLIFMEGYWELRTIGRANFKSVWHLKRVAMHKAILALFFSMAMTAAVTNVIKNMVSRKRPDFVSRCWPDGKIIFDRVVDFPPQFDMDGGYAKCSGPTKEVKEGMRSFPSGHSSISMAGLGMIGWELLKTLHAGRPGVHVWRPCLGVVPFFLAVLVAISRVLDHWHHWQDVTVGLILGFVISYVAFWIWFPLSADEIRGAGGAAAKSSFKHRPSPPETEGQLDGAGSVQALQPGTSAPVTKTELALAWSGPSVLEQRAATQSSTLSSMV